MARILCSRLFMKAGAGFGLVLSALAGIPSCGSEEGSRVTPCESELQCGQPCDASNRCEQGRFCGPENICTAECVVGDSRCGQDRRCDDTGRCVATPVLGLGGTTGAGGTGAAGSGGVCADAKITLDKQIPTVLLLVDQSGSMDAKFGTSDRWQVLRTALMNSQDGLVSTLQQEVRFGLALYSGRDGANPCPIITSVAPTIGNYAAIDMAYPKPTSAIIDDTPTAESIASAANILKNVTEPGPKVIVLATDGEPDTCAEPDPPPERTQAAKDKTVAAAQAAFKQGIFTFYISVGNEISDKHATEVANVGQGFPQSDTMRRFYRANSQAELASAFSTIVSGVRTCSFQLNGMVKEGAETKGTVTLDGTLLKLNDANGWRLSSPTTVELVGAACDAIKDDKKHDISAQFTCGTIVPFEPPK